MDNIEKKIVIKYTRGNLIENKLFPCPVYININGAIKFVDTIMVTKNKILEILDKHNTVGPIVINYDEVIK